MRLARAPQIEDDLGAESLKQALQIHIAYWKSRNPGQILRFGPKEITASRMLTSFENLLKVLESDPQNYKNYVSQNFDFYEVYGDNDWGEAYITGYYEPILDGSHKPKAPLTQPLYKVPEDLVLIDLKAFGQTTSVLRGRVVRGKDSRFQLPSVVPYHARAEIDGNGALKGQKLEWVYVDPIEAFFLQIQGSGKIKLPDGKILRLGYSNQNGHSYVPIGRYLKDHIPLEEMSLQRIENHMRTKMTPIEQQNLMNQNPSYVFFQKLEGEALTAMGTPVVPGRTIATDTRYFPKGALAFLEFEKPQFTDPAQQVPDSYVKTGRIVMDQDTGGAIRGPHRVDLFCGTGAPAKQMSGVMKHPGKLWYLVPRETQTSLP